MTKSAPIPKKKQLLIRVVDLVGMNLLCFFVVKDGIGFAVDTYPPRGYSSSWLSSLCLKFDTGLLVFEGREIERVERLAAEKGADKGFSVSEMCFARVLMVSCFLFQPNEIVVSGGAQSLKAIKKEMFENFKDAHDTILQYTEENMKYFAKGNAGQDARLE
ncbi:hypothetical protein Tco_1134137 [Tanacetum coccineum]